MATVAQMTLTLDSSSAQAGVREFQSSMNMLGTNMSATGKRGEDAFNGIESAERRAHLSGKLALQTLGVEMPRALETVIARSQVLGPLLAGMFNVSVFIAGAAALGGIVSKIVEMADSMTGYTDEVKKMEAETLKANQEAWLHPETLALTNAHLQQINDQMGKLAQAKAALDEAGPEQVGGLGGGGEELAGMVEQLGKEKGIQESLNALSAQQVELVKRKKELEEQLNVELEKMQQTASLAGLSGNALLAKQHEIAVDEINKAFAGNQDKLNAALEAEDKIYLGHRVELARTSSSEIASAIRSAQESASVAGLSGLAKLDQEEQNEQADAARRYGANEQLKTAIAAKYAAERVQVMAAAEKQTEELEKQARDSGLQGDALIAAQWADTVSKAMQGFDDTTVSWDQMWRQIIAASEIANNKIQQNDAETTAKRKQLMDQAAEDQQTAEQAIVLATVSEWQRAYAQIEIESQKRLAEIDTQERRALAQYGQDQSIAVAITEASNAKREAVWAETNQKIAEENKKQVEQLGADLQSVFDDITSGNIGQRILKNFEKLFFQILAQWLLTTKQMGSGFGSLFGSLLFGPGSSGANFFGGGASGNPLGMLLPGMMGGGSTGTMMGTPPFFPTSATSGGSIFAPSGSSGGAAAPSSSTGTLDSFLFGPSSSTGLASAFGLSPLGTSGTFGASPLSLLFGGSTVGGAAAGALTTQSMGSLGQIMGAGGVSGAASLSPITGILGGLFSKASVAPIAMMGLLALGSKLGGVGQAGAMFTSLSLMAALNPTGPASMFLTSLGSPFAALGPALLGFGIGEKFGPLGGALAGGASGAGIGALIGLLGGPIGALIGGIVGAIAGLFGGLFGGGKRKKAAENYWSQQIQPAIKQVVEAYESFQLDFTSANTQLEQLRSQAQDQLGKLKGEGKDEFKKVVAPAINAAEKQISDDETERNRRAGLVFGPPQFHSGGLVDATAQAWTAKPGELLALLRHGEYVMTPQATAKNLPALQRMNAGGTAGLSVGGNFSLNLFPAQLDRAYVRGQFVNDVLDALKRASIEGKA